MSLALLPEVRCARPFSWLGWQKAEKGLLIRVYLPKATAVEVFSFAEELSLGTMQPHPEVAGVFELHLPRKRKTEPYKLQVNHGHYRYELIDPYLFKDEAFYAVHYVNVRPENLYQQLGAQVVTLPVGKTQYRVLLRCYNLRSPLAQRPRSLQGFVAPPLG